MKGIPQGRYTKEFREEAVKMVTESQALLLAAGVALPGAVGSLFLRNSYPKDNVNSD
jgi:transposase-like protein